MLPMVARYVAFAFLCLLATNRHKKARYSIECGLYDAPVMALCCA